MSGGWKKQFLPVVVVVVMGARVPIGVFGADHCGLNPAHFPM